MTGVEGQPVGVAAIEEAEGGVSVTVVNSEDSGLASGEHGLHIHETGICDPSGDEPFDSAGAHFNSTDSSHGGPDTDQRHAGDLGIIKVNDDGTFTFEVTVQNVGLGEDAENALADEDGSALLIHADPDDLETDPGGESGGRIACGIIFQNTLPVASPAATPEATPATLSRVVPTVTTSGHERDVPVGTSRSSSRYQAAVSDDVLLYERAASCT